MSGLEGVGEAVTGGMLARAVEPPTGGGEAQSAACLNCGASLVGSYCHRCGQAGQVHRTLRAFGHDIAHSVLHFDGKIWRTLPLLAWKPGELTRRYIDGQRARFVSPMALFLFSVFLMFAVFSTVGGPFSLAGPSVDPAEAARDIKDEQAELGEQLKKLRAELDRARAAGAPTTAIALSIESVEAERAAMEATARVIAGGNQAAIDEVMRDDAMREMREEMIGLETGWPPLDAAIEKANANPSLLLYKIQTNAYKFSWALIPISVPFVWLLFFWKRRFKIYDHTVFVTYSIAFMSLGVITLSLLRPLGLGAGFIASAMTFLPPIHMYRQLRGTYALSRFSALWRTFVLLIFASIAATWFLMLLVALGALS
jgi:hypothetical protein